MLRDAGGFLPGYFQGKRRAEEALASAFPGAGCALRPGFIYGTRQVGGVGVPLGAIGTQHLQAVHGTGCLHGQSAIKTLVCSTGGMKWYQSAVTPWNANGVVDLLYVMENVDVCRACECNDCSALHGDEMRWICLLQVTLWTRLLGFCPQSLWRGCPSLV